MSSPIPAAKRRRARHQRSAAYLLCLFTLGTLLIFLVFFDVVGR